MTARVVFLGTPEAAVPTLRAVSRDHEVSLVITQPDRPRGRSGQPVPTPIKQEALSLGLPIAQPDNRTALLDSIATSGDFDVGVVVAYGRILRPEVLDLPTMGFLNAHFSLLPRWRGAAPVARALLAGDPMTGVTIMRLDEGLDTGPVLTAQAIDITPDENCGRLTARLASLGARLLTASIDPYLAGDLEPVVQSDDGVTYADKIEPADRPIDITAGSATIVNQVRALSPSPAATLDIDGDRHKILEVRPHEAGPSPGTWVTVARAPVIGTADGGLQIVRLQPPGRTAQTGAEWARGRRRDSGLVA